MEEIANGGDESVYFDSSDCGSSVYISDEEEGDHAQSRRSRYPVYDTSAQSPCIVLGMGMTSLGLGLFTEAITKYSIDQHRDIKCIKNDRTRVKVPCKWEGCPWFFY